MKRLFIVVVIGFMFGVCVLFILVDYVIEKLVFDLQCYFNGDIIVYGIFINWQGLVVWCFIVLMKCQWIGDEGVFDEVFIYSDGKIECCVWCLKKLFGGKYIGIVSDVVGVVQGQVLGNVFQWVYMFKLLVDDKIYEVQFDDWMYLIDECVMFNKVVMSKFGIWFGEVILFFQKN